MATRETRDERINLRASSTQAEIIRHAASTTDSTVTDFVLASAMVAAEQVLADRRLFRLDDVAWEEFQAALDRPAVYKPKLADLLSDADPFID